MSLVDSYQEWRCGDQAVTIGIQSGIALFARCTCPKPNREAEIELGQGEKWSWESSYCVHTYTVLAHFYASSASGYLETERTDHIDVDVVETYSTSSEGEEDHMSQDERQEQILEYISENDGASIADIQENTELTTHNLIYDLYDLMQLGKIYSPEGDEIYSTAEELD